MTQSWQKSQCYQPGHPVSMQRARPLFFIVRYSFHQYVGQKALGKRETLLTANLTIVQKFNL